MRVKKDDKDKDKNKNEYDTGVDTNLDNEMEAGKHGARKEDAGMAETDEDGYMAFNVPWSLSIGYGITMRENTAGDFNYEQEDFHDYGIAQSRPALLQHVVLCGAGALHQL